MEFKTIIQKSRSYRRFFQDRRIGAETLRGWVDLARQTPSGRNMQPLKYRLVHDPAECAKLFPLTAWAGYLPEWPGPKEGERPAAYIVMCNDTALAEESRWDQGIAAQTILLAATEAGYGGCIIGALRKPELVELLSLPENLVPVLVLALGVPKETVVLTEVGPDGNIQYYRDEDGIHYVPKRALDEVIIR
jgi:nitroreductase